MAMSMPELIVLLNALDYEHRAFNLLALTLTLLVSANKCALILLIPFGNHRLFAFLPCHIA